MSAALTPLEDALTHILSQARCIDRVEPAPLADALGRVLAEAQTAPAAIPPFANSAVDGYALRQADAPGPGAGLMISQRIAAGSDPQPLAPGTAARIFTGAVIPAGADTVVMQENCERRNEQVFFNQPVAADQNIRRAGNDVAAGSTLLPAGHRLRPQDLGLLASAGLAEVPCYRRLRVSIISTGDELVEPGKSLAPGQIYNSNRYTLLGLLQQFGCEVKDSGIVADTPEATRAACRQRARTAT